MANRLDVNVALLFVTSSESLLSNLVGIDDGNLSLVTIEDLCDFLESRALGLDVKEDDEKEFE